MISPTPYELPVYRESIHHTHHVQDNAISILSAGEEPQKKDDRMEIHDVMDALHLGSEAAQAFDLAKGLNVLGGAVGTAGLVSGIYFGRKGISTLKEAVKNRDLTAGIEGAGHTLLAGGSVIDMARLAAHSSAITAVIGPAAAAIINSPALQMLGTGLGVAHGSAEVVVGAKEMYEGYKAHDKKHMIAGLLDAVTGASITAIALGAGPVAGVIAVTAFGLQMYNLHHAGRHENTASPEHPATAMAAPGKAAFPAGQSAPAASSLT